MQKNDFQTLIKPLLPLYFLYELLTSLRKAFEVVNLLLVKLQTLSCKCGF